MKFSKIIKVTFRKYFLVGLIVLVPFVVTIKFLIFIVNYFDGILHIKNGYFLYIIPEQFHPNRLLGFHIPGLGIFITIFFIITVGILSRNILGRRLIHMGDLLINKIPLVRTIYKVVKEALETYAASSNSRYSRVVLIQYPRQGLYTMAFVTGEAIRELQNQTAEKVINVFVPTTPNPTSGFYLMVPEKDAIPLQLTIEDAFKLIVSGGVVSPDRSRTPIDSNAR